LITRISIEAVVIGTLIFGLFHWEYGSAPLPATLAAIVGIILAVVIDYFWFGIRRGRNT
jgi:membrane protease YdiL (CAAX protease family)